MTRPQRFKNTEFAKQKLFLQKMTQYVIGTKMVPTTKMAKMSEFESKKQLTILFNRKF